MLVNQALRAQPMSTASAQRGVLYAAAAYTCWGFFPIYFKTLSEVPATEMVLHRVIWSFGLLLAVLAVRGQWHSLQRTLREPRTLALFALSAVLIAVNWLVYIYATTSGRIVEASLGYFINPLMLIALGAVVLGERLNRAQKIAVLCAALGVVWLTLWAGRLPWIALVIAASFASYGLLRKTAPLGALDGLWLETALLLPIAALGLSILQQQGDAVFFSSSTGLQVAIALCGPLTALPLLLFAAGARRIEMKTLGILQYISPTLQFIVGVWLYHEPFAGGRVAGFALIWLALLIYSFDAFRQRGRAS